MNLILVVSLLIKIVNSEFIRFVERCPTREERRMVSPLAICSTPEVYHCLKDDDFNLVEICNKEIQLPSGNYPRYTSFTDRVFYEPCLSGRYQPWPVKSYEIADCELIKSSCSGVGQVVCGGGSTKVDITCGCDYNKRYVPTWTGSTRCCSPSGIDDCNCHYQPCQNESQELNADYQCIDKCQDGSCRLIEVENSTESIRTAVTTSQVMSFVYPPKMMEFITVCILTVIICGVILLTSINLGTRQFIKERTTYDLNYQVKRFELLSAATDGNKQKVQMFKLEGYVDFSDSNYDHRSALHLAVSAGKVDVVKYLLHHRCCHLNAVDRWGNTALKDAETLLNKEKDNKELVEIYQGIVEMLKEEKKHSRTDEHDTHNFKEQIASKLIHAADTGHLDRIRKLHQLQTDMDLADSSGRTALQAAVDKDQDEIVRFLLDICKVSPFIRWHPYIPSEGRSDPAMDTEFVERSKRSIKFGLCEIREKQISDTESYEEMKLSEDISQTKVLLLQSASRGDIRKIRGLLKARCDLNLYDNDKRTALHVAVSDHQEHIVEFLLQCKVDIHLKDRWNKRALDEATEKGKRDILKIFQKYYKDITDTLSRDYKTYELLSAGAEGNTDRLKRRYNSGYDMEMRDYDGRTALHLAAANGHWETVEFLVKTCNVKRDIPDRGGRTPKNEALAHYNKQNEYHKSKIPDILSTDTTGEPGSDKMKPHQEVNPICEVNEAAARGDIKRLTELSQVYMDAGDYLKFTPLHVAAAKGQLKFVKYLVETHGVSLFYRNSFWETPIRLACQKRRYWEDKIEKEVNHKKFQKKTWEDYDSDLESESESDNERNDTGQTCEIDDKHIHRRINAFKEVEEYLRSQMRNQIRNNTVTPDESLANYTEDELTFLFLNKTYRGDIAAVKRYVAFKESIVNRTDYDERTALHVAVSEGHCHLVIYFLQTLKVNTKAEDRWGNTPIMDAENNKDDKMRDLINKYSR